MARPRRVITGSLYDQGETLSVHGLDTYVVRAGPRGGTPVVFLHGIPTSAYEWREVLRAMYEEVDCVAFDWPGFGTSAKPQGLELTHRARAEHLEALLDAMQLDKVILVGHDIGGPPAMLFALENPTRVEKLALLNTTVYRRGYRPPVAAWTQFVPLLKDIARPFFNRPAFDFFFRAGLARPKAIRPEVLEHHWELARHQDGLWAIFESWAQMPEGMVSIEAIRAKMKDLAMPTLVLFGAEDPYLPPSNADRLARGLPNAELQLLPGAGHFLMEDAPEEVAERLLAFVHAEK